MPKLIISDLQYVWMTCIHITIHTFYYLNLVAGLLEDFYFYATFKVP